MTKILFLMDTLCAGGAEKVLRTLVNNMDQSKFDITVQTLEKEDPAGLLRSYHLSDFQQPDRCR